MNHALKAQLIVKRLYAFHIYAAGCIICDVFVIALPKVNLNRPTSDSSIAVVEEESLEAQLLFIKLYSRGNVTGRVLWDGTFEGRFSCRPHGFNHERASFSPRIVCSTLCQAQPALLAIGLKRNVRPNNSHHDLFLSQALEPVTEGLE